MEFRNLKHVKLEEIVECLSKSFEGYFVPMPSEVNFWKVRFENSRVEQSLSWGAFDDNRLVGFVINAVDVDNGFLTAFNTGTGILPAYRGNQLVDKMYDFGISEMEKKGIKRYTLEVIDKNQKAIRVYKRIGYSLNHKLFCYKGSLSNTGNLRIQEVTLKDVEHYDANQNYSWDNKIETLRKAGEAYKTYEVFEKGNEVSIGYFIINPTSGSIAQLESKEGKWDALFDGISQIKKEVRINNIKEDRKELMSYLNEMNFENTINQFEMEMNI